jgi:monofunctional chorismate mutase
MKDLDALRVEIDIIDRQIVMLLEKRMKVVEGVAQFKQRNHVPVLDSSREAEVLIKNKKYVENREYIKIVEDVFKTIMESSKEFQKEYLNRMQGV